jgi:hypothetical protein
MGSKSMKTFDLIPLILFLLPEGEGIPRFAEVGLYNLGRVRI